MSWQMANPECSIAKARGLFPIAVEQSPRPVWPLVQRVRRRLPATGLDVSCILRTRIADPPQ